MYDLINPTAPRWTLGPRRRPANFQRVGGNARESYISASDHHGDMHGSCELETEVLEMADGPNGVDLAASKGCRFRSGPGLQRLRIAAEEKQPTGQCTPTRLERGTRCEFVQCGRGCSSAHRPEATAWLSRPLFPIAPEDDEHPENHPGKSHRDLEPPDGRATAAMVGDGEVHW